MKVISENSKFGSKLKTGWQQSYYKHVLNRNLPEKMNRCTNAGDLKRALRH